MRQRTIFQSNWKVGEALLTAQTYEKLSAPFRKNQKLLSALLLLNRGLTLPIYAAYPLLLLWLLCNRDPRFLRVLLVPAISFILLSFIRGRIDAPRPYEALDIQPLIHKDTKGHSFPSRHVFSASVIACAFLYIIPPIGIILLIFAVLLAIVRVLGGVHFPRDVLAGFCIGLLSGWLGFVFPCFFV